jgi:hypothetical protein
MNTKTEATVDDLYRVPENGKAEIVNGELVLMSPTGGVPGRTAGKIYITTIRWIARKSCLPPQRRASSLIAS